MYWNILKPTSTNIWISKLLNQMTDMIDTKSDSSYLLIVN